MTKFKEITTVLFDFDGTLIQLNLDFPKLYQEAYSLIERYGIDISPYQDLFLIELEEAITASLQRNNPEKARRFQKEMREFLRKREIAAAEEAEVVPGACQTLKRFRY